MDNDEFEGHTFRVISVWLAVAIRFCWWRSVLDARNHRLAARTGYGCSCGMEYKRWLRRERRSSACPNRQWHSAKVREYLGKASRFRSRMREDIPPFPLCGVDLRTQASWMVAGGPPWLCLQESRGVARG